MYWYQLVLKKKPTCSVSGLLPVNIMLPPVFLLSAKKGKGPRDHLRQQGIRETGKYADPVSVAEFAISFDFKQIQ
jgi:hypothetical protein